MNTQIDRMHPTLRGYRFVPPVRRGITILEVLIAAGVLAIGMLGVMALIPLIAMRLREGEIADRSAVLSRNALEEARVRGWTESGGWQQIYNDGSNPSGSPPEPTLAQISFIPNPSAVCIDPLGVAELNINNSRRFPVNVHPLLPATNSYPWMPRVTPTSVVTPLSAPGAYEANRALAEFVAVAEDDLLVDRPESRNDLPRQTFRKTKAELDAAGVVVADYNQQQTRRMAQRDYSWFVTLASLNQKSDYPYPVGYPRFVTPIEPNAVYGARGNYLLSAVVCVQRDRNYGDDEEVLGLIESGAGGFTTTGVRGGEVVISAVGAPDGRILDIQAGDWVLLSIDHPPIDSDPVNPPNTINYDPPPVHRWYQVTEAAPAAPGDTSKAVTLLGSDWEFWDYQHVVTGDPIPTQVTWIPSVVSVSEKTVTLGQNGAWK